MQASALRWLQILSSPHLLQNSCLPTPAQGCHQTVAQPTFLRRIGDRRARELMLTNRVLSAEEALDWGLINQVVEADVLDDTVSGLANNIANGPTLAFGSVKSLFNASFDNGLETQMELESRAIADMARSADGKTGIAAFLAKQKPVYRGQ